ncbi:MAG: hypothetical protein KKB50_14940 [Planctomycetes bacterium]|nr:hypothetical protein [Planctomycetota bacterium]
MRKRTKSGEREPKGVGKAAVVIDLIAVAVVVGLLAILLVPRLSGTRETLPVPVAAASRMDEPVMTTPLAEAAQPTTPPAHRGQCVSIRLWQVAGGWGTERHAGGDELPLDDGHYSVCPVVVPSVWLIEEATWPAPWDDGGSDQVRDGWWGSGVTAFNQTGDRNLGLHQSVWRACDVDLRSALEEQTAGE